MEERFNTEQDGNLTPEITHTWNKIVRDSRKIGFRNGAANGQDESFQDHFDKGYSLGFATGFALGKYKGALRGKSIQSNEEHRSELLNNSRAGCCCMCRDDSLLQQSIENIETMQFARVNTSLQSLHSKYANSLNVHLKSQLD